MLLLDRSSDKNSWNRILRATFLYWDVKENTEVFSFCDEFVLIFIKKIKKV
jgi:hypothetical protein